MRQRLSGMLMLRLTPAVTSSYRSTQKDSYLKRNKTIKGY